MIFTHVPRENPKKTEEYGIKKVVTQNEVSINLKNTELQLAGNIP
jgi:hypothetical protein